MYMQRVFILADLNKSSDYVFAPLKRTIGKFTNVTLVRVGLRVSSGWLKVDFSQNITSNGIQVLLS